MSDIQIWCDHCHEAFSAEFQSPITQASCPTCSQETVAILCEQCGERSEIARLKVNQETWICPTCKEHFVIPLTACNEPVATPQTAITTRRSVGSSARARLTEFVNSQRETTRSTRQPSEPNLLDRLTHTVAEMDRATLIICFWLLISVVYGFYRVGVPLFVMLIAAVLFAVFYMEARR